MHKAIEIKIGQGELTASMVIKKAILDENNDLPYPELQDVLDACKEAHVTYGIDKNKILKSLNYTDGEILIAIGKRVIPTIKDRVVYTFEDMRNKTFTPTMLANEKVDFYNLAGFKIVNKKELLVTIKKGRAGISGMTVINKEIKPDNYTPMAIEELKRFSGPNTKLTYEGIVSTIDGIPAIDSNGRVTVDEAYTIDRDINFATGSIDYNGPVLVTGSLTNNFSVKSTKDVIIEGIIDGGTVESGGMVTVVGGINKGKVTARMNIGAKYIYSSEIESEGSVIVEEAILNSRVKAKGVIARGEPDEEKSGQISGGSILTSDFVWAHSLGSPAANYTEIKVVDFIDKKKLLEDLKQKLELAEYEQKKYYRIFLDMEDYRRNTPNLPADFKMHQQQVLTKRTELKEQTEELVKKIEYLEENTESEFDKKVFVTHSLYAKVRVQIDKYKLITTQEYGPSIIYIHKREYALKISPPSGDMEIPGY